MGCKLCSECETCPHGGVMECDSSLGWNQREQLDPDGWDYYSDDNYYEDYDGDCYEEDSDRLPSGAISWTEAGQHIGETVTIFGLVKSIFHKRLVVHLDESYTYTVAPTFIEIGAEWPNPKRVRLVIWETNRRSFPTAPETLYSEKSICVTGRPYLYSGFVNIAVSDPSSIQIIEPDESGKEILL